MAEKSSARGINLAAVQAAASMLKCIGHPIRLQIIDLLDRVGELNVTTIYETLGIEQAVASQHLNLMRDKGILASRRDGVNVFYRIVDPRITHVIDCIHHHCDV
ncbi:MAG: helix-turn-helix transcriptional regulator [Gemmatimonadetes bacterium]|uniref:Helix-turn-helix transcriptional regulator n=1 Tax=Candidatus Kutchimonas denitrificans TaxID=3056748 RepID=A0AAE5CC17_9BACT|nr:helix-turn-helix transcriptional regulator [Gemmatimonadota bacterium]NIR73679.1 helix-turn-helix transcriptional regulator [Candidatus Kutchimonas denitrificans]NIS00729.1 helix-turn-helix transcriptional regulator [Gemmatimonadota bacterium]NIT66316.1 helix-turn-helix transcriptional regulator [Gemmatimonadota bacterium]NIU51534.1 metalloregulator ArsR/SmtB family transcription factor [Gemmatimonadota bacterium]